jgi:hypothetical protein
MSRHTIEQLEALQRDRNQRWLTAPPIGIARLSREDQYLDEGLWHVRERNERWDAGEITAAWRENLILERFFTPVLDRPTYASRDGNRWPPEHRADAQARADHSRQDFISVAEPYPILDWDGTAYWIGVGAAAAILAAAGVTVSRKT